MAKSETYINFIVDELLKGNVKHKEVLALCGTKWQLSQRSFNRYWNTANERYKNELQALNEAKQAIHTETEMNTTRANVLSKIQAKEILTTIAQKEQSKSTEKIQAIKALADLEGWNEGKVGEIKGIQFVTFEPQNIQGSEPD